MLSHIVGLCFVSCLSGIASEKSLSVRILVKHDTEGCSHVYDLTVCVVFHILTGISASVAVNVVKLVLDVGWAWVKRIVGVWLCNLANPRLNGHKLLDSFICLLEERIVLHLFVVIRHTIVAVLDSIACLLVKRTSLPACLFDEIFVVFSAACISR